MTKKPFFRAFDGWWYAQVRVGSKRQQIKLVKGQENEEAAWRAFHCLLAQDPAHVPEASQLKVAHVCDLFLSYSQHHNDERTFRWYRKYLQSFCDLFGTLGALDVKPIHVTRWLDSHPKWLTSRRCAVICIKRSYNWAESEGILNTNPMKRVRKPPPVQRARILTPEEWSLILATVRDQEFRDFLFALRETGCRPGEVRKVTAGDVNLELGVWVLEHHKTRKKTGLPRVVYLTPGMIELCRSLITKWPEGPLFRGPRGGKPLTRNGVRCRFRRLRQKLPQLKGVICYTLRHSFVTDALERGIPAATVAELVGHKDLKMLTAHYAHLSEKRQHLADAARKAAGYLEATPTVEKKSA